MKKLTIKTACAVMTAVLGISVMTGCGSSKVLDGTQTVATVNDIEIPAGVASFAVRYQQAQTEYYYEYMYALYGLDSTDISIWDDETDEEGMTYGDEMKEEALELLIEMYLIRENADTYSLEITDEQSEAITEAAAQFIEENDETTLTKMGVSQSDIEEYLELYTYYYLAYDPLVEEADVEVTDEEAAQSTITYLWLSYDEEDEDDEDTTDEDTDAEDTDEEEEESLTADEAYAIMEAYLEEIQASDDPSSFDMDALQDENEDLTVTTYSYGEDDDTLSDGLLEAVEELDEDGEVYDGVVEGDSGYYVVRMDAVYDEEATEENRQELLEEAESDAFDEALQTWYDEADVEIIDSVWDLIEVKDSESFVVTYAEDEDETDTEETDSEETDTEETDSEETTETDEDTDTDTDEDTEETEETSEEEETTAEEE